MRAIDGWMVENQMITMIRLHRAYYVYFNSTEYDPVLAAIIIEM